MKITVRIFLLLFFITACLVLYIDANSKSSDTWVIELLKYKSLIFGLHMACWMVAGMMANYFWDLLNAGKTFSDTNIHDLFLPILVLPIIYYVVWSLWGGEKGQISFSWNLVAFQNGFFWQVILSKAGPVRG